MQLLCQEFCLVAGPSTPSILSPLASWEIDFVWVWIDRWRLYVYCEQKMKMYDVFSWYGFQHEACKESCFQQLIRSCAYLQMYGAIHYAVQVKANRKAASPPDWLVCIQVHWIKRKNLAMKNWSWQDFKARDVMKSCYPIGVCRVNAKQTGHRLLKWCACCGRQVPTAITVGIGLFIRFMLPIPEGLQMWSFCVLLSPFQDCSLLLMGFAKPAMLPGTRS